MASTPKQYDAVVIGAGPGGLTCASNLLDQGLSKICLIDPRFTAGRINERYREVPSNTKVTMFCQWATGTKAFSQVIDKALKPNPYEKLASLPQDKGCILGDAIDVATMVDTLSKNRDVWSLPKQGISTPRVVLAHGSHPRPHDIADHYPHLTALGVDTCLRPSWLRTAVPAGSTVGVIGSSHSAVLILKNLFDLGDVSIANFYRSPLLYAEFKDGWILYDNTGLKGMAADWAREVLAAKHLPPRLRRVNLREDTRTEQQIYDAELVSCTHLVAAIGYDMNPVPKIQVDGSEVEPAFDQLTGKFFMAKGDQHYLPGLFGAGIAYPERVTDPEGNVESAVGWFKFMKFVKRVAPTWVGAGDMTRKHNSTGTTLSKA